MKIFLLTNTNKQCAWNTLKVLIEYSKKNSNFVVVLDQKYDIFLESPVLYKKIFYVDSANVSDLFKDNEVVHLDFSIGWFVHHCRTYEEYAKLMVLEDKHAEVSLLEFYKNSSINRKINKFLSDNDDCKYSNVLVSIENEDYFDIINDYLKDKVNIIIPTDDFTSIELYFLTYMCDFVITDGGVVYTMANDISKPTFVICDKPYNNIEKKDTTFIFDPFKNDLAVEPPKIFELDYEQAVRVNHQIMQYSRIQDLLYTELKECLDKFFIPYVISDSTTHT